MKRYSNETDGMGDEEEKDGDDELSEEEEQRNGRAVEHPFISESKK